MNFRWFSKGLGGPSRVPGPSPPLPTTFRPSDNRVVSGNPSWGFGKTLTWGKRQPWLNRSKIIGNHRKIMGSHRNLGGDFPVIFNRAWGAGPGPRAVAPFGGGNNWKSNPLTFGWCPETQLGGLGKPWHEERGNHGWIDPESYLFSSNYGLLITLHCKFVNGLLFFAING